MKEYILFSVLCFGCFCAAQFYDAPALDDYSLNDDFWVNDNDYKFEQLDKDINIDNQESFVEKQNDDSSLDLQDKELLDVENNEEKIPIENNEPTGEKSDKILSRELEDVVVNEKEDEVNDDVYNDLYDQLNDLDLQLSNKTEEQFADENENGNENLEDVKFEGAPVVNNQTDLNKIVKETQDILAESNSSDMDNIKSFAVEQKPEQSEDTVAKVNDDLHEDLSNLYNTWDKLKSDDENEVPDIFKDVSNKKEVENIGEKKLNVHDIIELDENDNEHFDEVDFDQLFDDLTKDMNDAANQTYQVIEENIVQDDGTNDIIADVNDIDEANAQQEDEALLEIAEENEIVISNEKRTTVTVKDLSSSGFTQLMEQFKEAHADDFADYKLRDSNPDIIELEGTEVVTVNSPNYPSPYPTNKITDWLIEGDGTGIELNVTDFDVNGALGDYVLFKPGGVDESGDKGIIMSYNLDTDRKFRFLYVNRMFVRFEAKAGMAFKKGFSFNVKMIFPPKNTTKEEEEDLQPPASLLPEPRHTLTIYLGGIPYNDFKEIQEDFKGLLADMATLYINENEIETQNETSTNTRITSTSFCNINWPGFESCVAVTFTIPVNSPDDEEAWRLNEDDLRAMWYTYVYMDPFAARLKRMGVEEFQVPNDGAIMTWWLVVGAAVAFCVLTLAVVLWRFSCIEDYTRMRIFSDSDSVMNEKRPLDLYPTPHQTLPPLYGDVSYSWPAEKGDNTTVDMPGYKNPNFVRDDILDFESDDEPARDRSSNRNSFANHKHIV